MNTANLSPASIAFQKCQSTLTNLTTNTADETIVHRNGKKPTTSSNRTKEGNKGKNVLRTKPIPSQSTSTSSTTMATGHQNWYKYDLSTLTPPNMMSSLSTVVTPAGKSKSATVERPLPRLNSTVMRERLKRRMNSFQKRQGGGGGNNSKRKDKRRNQTSKATKAVSNATDAVEGGNGHGVLHVFANFSDYLFACQPPDSQYADGTKSEGTAYTTNLGESSDASESASFSHLDQLRRKYLPRNNPSPSSSDNVEERSPQQSTLREDAQLLERTRKDSLVTPRTRRQRSKQCSTTSHKNNNILINHKSLVAPKLRVFRSRSSPVKSFDAKDIVRELQKEEHDGILRDLQKGEVSQETLATESGSLFSFSDLSTSNASSQMRSTMTQSFSSLSMTRTRSIQGPASGTFENVASEEDNVDHEVLDTYTTYRMNQTYVNSVIRGIPCSLQLYHSKLSGSNTLKHACSEPIASNFQVRGVTYQKDGMKVPSKEAIFALLGADNLTRTKGQDHECHTSLTPDSYLNKLRVACKKKGIQTPFVFVVNFVVPWGNFVCYFYRPDGSNGGPLDLTKKNDASEKLLKDFLEGDTASRNQRLKFIPNVVVGPWTLRKIVGTNPAMIGQKIPTTYYGSVDDGYVEICLNVTKGGKLANSICSAVAGKASAISIDLSFLLQGENEKELPEQVLSVIRLHHVKLKI